MSRFANGLIKLRSPEIRNNQNLALQNTRAINGKPKTRNNKQQNKSYLYRMRIHDLINEIHEMSGNTPRKAAFDIYNLLENNKTIFSGAMDADTFGQILNSFEKLAYSSAAEFNSPAYKEEFQKVYNLLSFYLNKVI